MSNRAAVFLAEWVRDSLIDGHDYEDAASACEALLKDAHSLGIGRAEFEEEVGDLDAHLRHAIEDHSGEQDRIMRESGVADA